MLFSRMIVLGFPLLPVVYLVSRSANSSRHGCHLVKQALNSIGKWLLTSVIIMPLLHQSACIARPSLLSLEGFIAGQG